MIVSSIEEFAAHLPPIGALAGLDLGTRTIGVAICDTLRSVATPATTIKRKKFTADAQSLIEIINERNLIGVVLGLPRNMDGSEGPRAQAHAHLPPTYAKIDLPIGFWDERLSTVAAEKALLEADATRKRRSEVIDHVAASYILQGHSIA